MRNLRICVVSQQYENILSGVGVYTRNIVKALRNDGHSVSLICPASRRSIPGLDGVELLNINNTALPRYRLGWLLLSYLFARRLHEIEKQREFDIIHFTDAREALFYAKRSRPIVANVNDYYNAVCSANPFHYKRDYPADWYKRWIYQNFVFLCEKYAYPRTRAVVCNSVFTRDKLKAAYHLSDKQLFVCYKSIDAKPFLKGNAPADDVDGPTVLFVGGGNMQRKGFGTLLNAAPTVAEQIPNIQFVIVGRDVNTAGIVRSCKGKDILNRFRFLGHVPNEVLAKYYKSASVFVMPSLTEAFGLVYLEAMASGTPVIGTSEGGTKEMIKDGENGFLIAPHDSKDLAHKMLLTIQNKEIRDRLIRKGTEPERHFSVERMISGTYEIYDRLLRE